MFLQLLEVTAVTFDVVRHLSLVVVRRVIQKAILVFLKVAAEAITVTPNLRQIQKVARNHRVETGASLAFDTLSGTSSSRGLTFVRSLGCGSFG
jgi:hypothetical protein